MAAAARTEYCFNPAENVDAPRDALLNHPFMLRPSIIALCLITAVSVVGCESSYRRMYSPKRSYFVPEKEEPRPTEILPPPTVVAPATDPLAAPVAPPPVDMAPAPAPAPDAAAPAIPGL